MRQIKKMLKKAVLIFSKANYQTNQIDYATLLKSVESNAYCSGSVILSLATYVQYKMPFLDLTDTPQNTPKITPEDCHVKNYMSYHPLHQLWSDMLVEAVLNNQAYSTSQTLYIVVDLIPQKYESLSKHSKQLHFETVKMIENQSPTDTVLKKQSNCKQIKRKEIKIGYLNVSGSQLRTDMYRPIINVKALVLGQVYDNQLWVNYDILKGRIPSVQEFSQLDAVLIPGSTNSVLTSVENVDLMTKNMMECFQKGKLKILGICYGHQLVAQHYKGELNKRHRTDKIQNCRLNQQLIQKIAAEAPFLEELMHLSELKLLEHHEDYVDRASQQFDILADSQTCNTEIMIDKTRRILSFQSHPEYYYEYTQAYVMRLAQNNPSLKGMLSFVKILEEKLIQENHKSADNVRRTISRFLNHQPKA